MDGRLGQRQGAGVKRRINACHMPEPVPPGEAEIYAAIRDRMIKAHCSADRAHDCCGSITFTRDAITMNCPLCGDSRGLITGK